MADQEVFLIVGLGMMGGSLAKALQDAFPDSKVMGCSRSKDKILRARELGLIDGGSNNLQECLQEATVVFDASPVQVIESNLELLEKFAQPGTLVTDLGSTKELITEKAKNLDLKNITFVGSHPICGSHHSGMNFFVDGLFSGAKCVVMTPTEKTKLATEKLAQIWEKLGCEVITLDAAKHDALLSKTSHMPHLLAYAMVGAQLDSQSELKDFIGGGYRSMTRIAESPASIWQPIFMANAKNLVTDTKELINELERLIQLIETNQSEELQKQLNQTAQFIQNLRKQT